MDREQWVKECRAALIRKGKTMKEMSRDIEYSYAHVSNVLSPTGQKEVGKASYRFIKAISDYCNVKPFDGAREK